MVNPDKVSEELIELRYQDHRLVLAPHLGGSVFLYTYRERDILRPPVRSGNQASPLDMAAFPMAPFIGRIGNAEFHFRGETIKLTPNFLPEPHAIHGSAWQGGWSVTQTTRQSVCLRYVYTDGDWPWAFETWQTFRVSDNALELSLGLKNTSQSAMPAGLGWHPYFPVSQASRIDANVHGVWENGEDQLPSVYLPAHSLGSLSLEGNVQDLDVDNCYRLTSGNIAIKQDDPCFDLLVSVSDTFDHLVVYAPPDADFFCIEPVSHRPNSTDLSSSEGGAMRVLEPQEELVGSITITIGGDTSS